MEYVTDLFASHWMNACHRYMHARERQPTKGPRPWWAQAFSMPTSQTSALGAVVLQVLCDAPIVYDRVDTYVGRNGVGGFFSQSE
jgi:hypothetical protein